MSINVIVNFNVKSNKLIEFTEILNNVKTELPKVEGCLEINIFRNSSNENIFTLIEIWDTKLNHQNHINKLIADGSWELILKHLATDPISSYNEKL
jgi:quinol monooxygenase YgiN